MREEKQVPVMFERLYELVIITDFVSFDKAYEKIVYCCLADGYFE